MLLLYRIYLCLIAIPLLTVSTLLAVIFTVAGCTLCGGRIWGYYPAKFWAKTICWLTFVKVTIKGRENISPRTAYVFVANHQGAFDIFSVYGYLPHNFRWLMKQPLRKIPFVGYACAKAHHIFVDNSTPAATHTTLKNAESILARGLSVVVFPEGSRSRSGKMHRFKRGAFFLASEFDLPVVPITIDGAYEVMPRGAKLPHWGHITLTIHHPIVSEPGKFDTPKVMEESYKAIHDSLPARLQ